MTRWFPIFAVLAVVAAPRASAQEAGAADFEKNCARCHSVAKAVDFLKAHPDAKERAAWLDRKLSRHHARDAAERARIIAFLERHFADAKK